MSALEVRQLRKQLGATQAVNDVTFEIREGEFFVMLGSSGSGKSTLLRLICGLERPDGGQILINGRDVTTLPARERNIGMVFQDYGLYPNMNVLQNIAYGLEARGGLSRTEIEQRSKEAAAKLGLSDLLQRLIVDLSGGEQQRVALARALAKQADVYLFDEPLSNLDPKLRYQARRDIITLHRNKRKPSLYVTHDQTEAFAMGDRIGIMAHGRLQQVGRAEELLNAPANLFVARFLGSPPMNLLKAEIADHNGTLWIISDGLSVLLPKKWRSLLNQRNTRNLVVGLRPNRLTWKDETTPADRHVEHTVTGTVVDVELLFGETVVSLRIGKDTTLMVVLQDSYGDMTLGQKLSLTIDLDELCLFDPETEQSLTLEHRQ